ncbi:MAG TPA: efflux RND transporter periplasmic adaptor subunit, partial [Planctomycetota bacterium]|nr:efflux RND transporter periplasmic adaptor subunit [Planctomycetota bacterium]
MMVEKTRRSGFQWLPLVLGVAAAGALVWYGSRPGSWFRPAGLPPLEGAKVQRGPLLISVVERGNLKAADSVVLKNEIEGQTTILYLIPEGTHVQTGDLLCELDATQLFDKKIQQEISVRTAQASFIKSKQAFDIQLSQNESDISQAEQALEFAGQDLRKYQEGDRKLEELKAEQAITVAEGQYKSAEGFYTWSEKLAGNGFLTQIELERDGLNLTERRVNLEQAQRERDLLLAYEIPRQLAELEADAQEAERELERMKLRAEARTVDLKADVESDEAKFKLESEKLAKLLGQIAKARILAPRAGMVVYAKQEGGRMGQADPIQEGTQVRERQEIITIPSATGMIAQASLHESVLKQVEVGQTCIVRVDALRGRDFRGRVKSVAPLPDQNSWWANPNLRVYRTDVEIAGSDPEMRPGMSCQIEILVEEIPDTLYVPVQAVYRQKQQNLCYVPKRGTIEARPVEVGRYNDSWVQILAGLEEGETVLLSPPAGVMTGAGTEEGAERPAGGQEPTTPADGLGASEAPGVPEREGPPPAAQGDMGAPPEGAPDGRGP